MLPTFKKLVQASKFVRVSYIPQRSFIYTGGSKGTFGSATPERHDPLADVNLRTEDIGKPEGAYTGAGKGVKDIPKPEPGYTGAGRDAGKLAQPGPGYTGVGKDAGKIPASSGTFGSATPERHDPLKGINMGKDVTSDAQRVDKFVNVRGQVAAPGGTTTDQAHNLTYKSKKNFSYEGKRATRKLETPANEKSAENVITDNTEKIYNAECNRPHPTAIPEADVFEDRAWDFHNKTQDKMHQKVVEAIKINEQPHAVRDFVAKEGGDIHDIAANRVAQKVAEKMEDQPMKEQAKFVAGQAKDVLKNAATTARDKIADAAELAKGKLKDVLTNKKD